MKTASYLLLPNLGAAVKKGGKASARPLDISMKVDAVRDGKPAVGGVTFAGVMSALWANQTEGDRLKAGKLGSLKVGESGSLKVGKLEGLKVEGSESLKVGKLGSLKVGKLGSLKVGESGSRNLNVWDRSLLSHPPTTMKELSSNAGGNDFGQPIPGKTLPSHFTHLPSNEGIRSGSPKVEGSESLKVGKSGSLKVGESGSLKVGESGSLKVEGSEGLKVGKSGSLKVEGSEGLKVGKSEGPKAVDSAGRRVNYGAEDSSTANSGLQPRQVPLTKMSAPPAVGIQGEKANPHTQHKNQPEEVKGEHKADAATTLLAETGKNTALSHRQVIPPALIKEPSHPPHLNKADFVEQVRLTIAVGKKELSVRLHPATLGRATVVLQQVAGALKVEFIIEDAKSRMALEIETPQLKEALASAGFSAVQIEIRPLTMDSHRQTALDADDQGSGGERESDADGKDRKDEPRRERMFTPKWFGYNTFDLEA